jgi:type I restriction enzyme, S subunit
MSFELIEYKFEDTLETLIDYRGKTPVKTTTGIPLITAKIIKGGRIERPTEFIAADNYDSWMRRGIPKAGDVVLTVEAPLGEVAQLGHEKVALAQRVVTLRGKQGVLDSTYLLYLLQSDELQQKLRARASGSTVVGIKQSELRKVIVRLPDEGVQKDIASILKSLDAASFNLEHQNTALEAIAQRLFRSWFVDFDPVHAKVAGNVPEAMSSELASLFSSEFVEGKHGRIPKGWRHGTIGDIAVNSRAQAKAGQIPANTPYVGLEHVPRRSLSLTSWGSSNELESGKFFFNKDDVLFGKLRPYFHKVVLSPTSGVCSTDILVIRPKSDEWLGFLCLHIYSSAFIQNATQLSDGARMPRTNWSNTANYKVVLPPNYLAKEYQRIVEPFFCLIHENILCIRRLAELRDHLLPRLISGKLSIGDAATSVAAITSGLETEPA